MIGFWRKKGRRAKKVLLPPYGRVGSADHLVETTLQKPANYARMLASRAPRSKKLRVLGPAEAPIFMIRGRVRFRLLIKAERGVDIQAFIKAWLDPLPKPKGGLKLTIDIDPHSFM